MIAKGEFERGAFYMLLSALTLSLFTLSSKFGTDTTPYFLIVFLRFAAPLVVLIPFLFFTISFKDLFLKCNLKMQLLRIGCILIYQYSIFYYLMHAPLTDATVMQNTAPLFIPIFERVFFKHPFEKRTLLSILISFIGVLCVLQPHRSIFAELSVVGLLVPLGQAGSQVLYSHQAKSENQKFNLFHLYFLGTVASGIVFLFVKLFFGAEASLAPLKGYTSWMWINLLFLAVTSILNQIFRGISYQHGKASAMAPFLYGSIIFSAIIDWAIFHHIPSWLSLVGAILVIAGGLIQLSQKK